METDVQFTSDGIGVLCHDSTIDRTSDGTGTISEMTYAELCQYDFGSWKSPDYTGTKIPTFEEFIVLCEELKLHPYIEIKEGATSSEIAKLVQIVRLYGMEDSVSWISFDINALNYVMSNDSTARIGHVCYGLGTLPVLSLKTDENEVFVLGNIKNLSDSKIDACKNAELPLEVWNIDNLSTLSGLNEYISGFITNKIPTSYNLNSNYEIVYQLTSSDLSYGYGIKMGYPYNQSNTGRATYLGNDLVLEPGYAYKFEYTSTVSTVQIGLRVINEDGDNLMNQRKPIPVKDYEEFGWNASGCEIIPYEIVNGCNPAIVLVTFRMDENDSVVEDGFITSVTISRTPIS